MLRMRMVLIEFSVGQILKALTVRVKMTDDKQVSANSDNDDEGEMVVHRADEDTELSK
ncbi:hypothetical protein T02_3245 [Trichinella nativa]|uniref:Uncharacterized protein n=1 Tax=Trichinella nativa TaxID=6335 RepID=A0A0V1LHQ0_9BILA|nr:hypothetical protein T02_3245 [Trichinella nativa]